MDINTLTNKMVSHRLKGFSQYEHSLSALKNACESGFHYLEVDTRVSKDGVIYVHHGSSTSTDYTKKINFAQSLSSEINNIRFKNTENILTLEECLNVFKDRKNRTQKLCLDIKDYGFEERHLDLVKSFDLEDNVVFVSWIPQTLIRLKEIGSTSPLILSHWNLISYKSLGKFAVDIFSNKIVSFGGYVLLGNNKFNSPLGRFSKGFQYAILMQKIPEDLLNILELSGGGICVHKKMLSKYLVQYCQQNNIKLWIFSVSDKGELYKYANEYSVDAVFCDANLTNP